MIEVDRAGFEELVAIALDEVPADLAAMIDNCVIMVEDSPPAEDQGLLGFYDGIPLTERGATYAGVLPDRIVIFRLPTLAICDTIEDVIEEVHITVVHEIAHHFGLDDERLHDLGYD